MRRPTFDITSWDGKEDWRGLTSRILMFRSKDGTSYYHSVMNYLCRLQSLKDTIGERFDASISVEK